MSIQLGTCSCSKKNIKHNCIIENRLNNKRLVIGTSCIIDLKHVQDQLKRELLRQQEVIKSINEYFKENPDKITTRGLELLDIIDIIFSAEEIEFIKRIERWGYLGKQENYMKYLMRRTNTELENRKCQ